LHGCGTWLYILRKEGSSKILEKKGVDESILNKKKAKEAGKYYIIKSFKFHRIIKY
jgi:hypothetical protein